MTLHSVATSYSETPTPAERNLMYSWLDLFRDTITCPHCRDHFTGMLANYRIVFPNMLGSRHEFAMFSFRAHNAVNRRLNKPMYKTLEECMLSLQTNVKDKTANTFRNAYLNHIGRYWASMRGDITGIVAVKKIHEMQKIEAEYISSRDTNFAITLASDVVILPRDVLEKDVSDPGRIVPRVNTTASRFRITGTGIRLRP